MNCGEPDALPGVSAEYRPDLPSPMTLVLDWLRGVTTVAEMELLKIRHDPTELLVRSVQPLLWLLIFGQAFGKFGVLSNRYVSYQVFITPGILAQSMMFTSIFFGISIIWERDLGLMQKFLVLPLPRSCFVVGKALGAGIRSLVQAFLIALLTLLAGIHLNWGLLQVVGVLITIVIGAMFFSCFSMSMAALLKTRERFMGVGQLFTMPFFFTSNALYPLDIMPHWLQLIARVNPLTYVVELLRSFLVTGNPVVLRCFGILVLDVLVIATISAWLYPKAVY